MKLAIRNGRVIDPATRLDAPRDVLIDDGRIVAVVEPGGLSDFDAARTVDARGLIVCPGLVDLSARLREPGSEYRATLESEIDAALAGGVTSLVCPPDTDPPLDEPGLVEMLKHRARTLNRTHVHPLGALTTGLAGVALTEMSELHDAGCVGFSQANVPIADTQVLLRALQYAQTFGFTVWWRPQDAYLGRGGVAASGPVAARLGLPSVPATNETIALLTIFELMRGFGGGGAAPHVHLCRLSSAGGVALVRAARAEGLPVSCDVGIHHVHLTDMDIGFFDSRCRIDPPLRGQRDRAAIREGLVDGTIDAICSDHTPVDDDAKLLPFGEAEAGATGLELLLPLVIKWADEDGLPLADALARVTCRAAAVVVDAEGAPVSRHPSTPTGRIDVGGAADLCVFDPEARWIVGPGTLKSQGRNTPFDGYELKGRVSATVVGGIVVHERGD